MVNTPGKELQRIKIPFTDTGLTPAIFAALGAAIGFYGYPLLAANFIGSTYPVLFFLSVFILIIAVLQVAASCPFLYYPLQDKKEVPALIQKTNIFAIALIAGLVYGFTVQINVKVTVIPLDYSRVTGLTGILIDDPRAFNDSRGIGSMEITRAAGIGGIRTSANGTIPVFFPAETIPRLKEFGRGSEIYVEGNMVSGSSGLLFRATQVHIINPAPALEQFRTGLRTGIMEKFGILQKPGSLVEAPVWSGLASAMLLGIRDNLDSELTKSFRNAGCSHILSLSGMNLAILSGVVVFFLRFLFGIRAGSVLGAVFIVAYIFIAGAQPSLVRSGIIYLLGTLSLLGYLRKNTISLLALAFIVQLLIQSEAAVSVSFLLSYVAMLGILVTGVTLRELFAGKIPEIVLVNLCASAGAFIASAGVTAFFFGELHPIGIIAGIFVMPIASLFMIVSFGSLVLISVIPVLFAPLNFVLTAIYNLLEFFITLAGKVPGLQNLSFVPVLMVSVIVILFLEFAKQINRHYRRSIASFDT
ncbi:MAG: ComEC/Rec2 family competence protein [Treponema sp.]|nr:ComEC/Rec2 family competence protein [Treponema sp.]